jgi:putative ABC transport system permease protein
MTTMRVWIVRLLGSLGLRSRDADVAEDIQAHLDLLADEFQRQGMSAGDARLAARRQFGGVAAVQEQYREQRRLPGLDVLAQDIRYALRTMGRAPGFTAIAVLTLALGIGANTAIFQVLYSLVIKPLPVRDPHQLVDVQPMHNGSGQSFSYPLLREMSARQTAVQGIFVSGAVTRGEWIVDGRKPSTAVDGRMATGNYFALLGTDAQVGRVFTETDDRPSAIPVAVISDAFWRREFGARTDALGKVLSIKNVHVTVVGVTRREFFGDTVGSYPDVWIPLSLVSQLDPNSMSAGTVWLQPMARLRPDVTLPQAEAQLDALFRQLRHLTIQWKDVSDDRLTLLPAAHGLGSLHEEFGRPLWILMGIVGMLALIACCNLANLLLARATARTHEMGVRLAVGATRDRLLRQLLTESALLAVIGAALAFLLARATATALVQLATIGQDLKLSLDADWRIAAFTGSIALVAVFVFGLAPAVAATRVGVSSTLQSGRRTHTGARSRHLTSNAFVVAQVMLCLMLVAGASLLTRSFWKLTHQDFGYQPERVLTANLDFDFRNMKPYFTPVFRQRLYEHVRAIPGIRNASLSMGGPLGNMSDTPRFTLPGSASDGGYEVTLIRVYPNYFETMGIPILAGRSINKDDRKGAPHVAVITETTARTFFGGENPIGRVLTGDRQFDPAPAIQVIGVSPDVRYRNPREPFKNVVFVPMEQVRAFSVPEIVLQIDGDASSFIEPLRRTVKDIAPGLSIWRLETLSETALVRLRRERLLAWLSAAFGALALILASIGLYGVVSYRVKLRTQEIGIRLALGAHPQRLRAMLLREVLQMVGLGLAAGVLATLALTGLLSTILYELSPRDPVTLVSAAVLLTAVALVAGFVPARRASRLDPMTALRRE